MKVHIDATCCQGNGRCYDLAPGLFGDDDDGYGTVLVSTPPAITRSTSRCE
jgi:ferredoxin